MSNRRASRAAALLLALALACTSDSEAPPEDAPPPAARAEAPPEDPPPPEGPAFEAAGITTALPEGWTVAEATPRHAVARDGEHQCVIMGARMGIVPPADVPERARPAGVRAFDLSAERTLRLRLLDDALIACALHGADDRLLAAIDRVLAGARARPAPAPAPAPASDAPTLVDLCLTTDPQGLVRHVYVLDRAGRVWSGPLHAEALDLAPALPPIAQLRCNSTALARTRDGRVFAADARHPDLAPAPMSEEIAAMLTLDGRAPRVLHLQPDGALLEATEGPRGPRGPAVARFAPRGDEAWDLGAGEELPAAGPRHRDTPGLVGDARLGRARLAVGSTLSARGCLVTDDGWLWCWTDERRPDRFPAVPFDPQDGELGGGRRGALGIPPAPVVKLAASASALRDLIARGPQVCAHTATALWCVEPDGGITRGPTCATVPCACRLESVRGEQCEDEPIAIEALFGPKGAWIPDVRAYHGPCVLRAGDQLWCRPSPGASHRRVALRPPPTPE